MSLFDQALPFLRIGHSGAGGLAPPNTLGSLALALELGVDMVEFDLRPCRDALVLLHNDTLPYPAEQNGLLASQCTLAQLKTLDLGGGERIPSLEEAIQLVKGRALINLDLKTGGCESAVLDVLSRHNITGDVLISSHFPDSLQAIRRGAPSITTGISYPEDRHNLSARPALKPVVRAAILFTRIFLPWRLPGIIRHAQADAVMLYHEVASGPAVRAAHAKGARVFVWTVDQIPRMQRLKDMGVDGIASNRPDLFNQLA